MKRKKSTLIYLLLAVVLSVSTVVFAATPGKSAGDYDISPKSINSYTYDDVTSISNVKENIYNSMINSVDFYDAVEGSFTTTFIRAGEAVTIDYQVDIPQQIAREVIRGSVENLENACLDEVFYSYNVSSGIFTQDYYASQLDNAARSAKLDYNACLPHAQKAVFFDGTKTIYDRVVELPDGEHGYYYRPDITNTAFANTSIFPQSLGMALLSSMDNWEITGVHQYLGRQAVVINGIVTDADYAQKISSNRFEIIVDMETGVLLDFKGYSEDKLTQRIETTSIHFLDSNINNGILETVKDTISIMEIESK